jgi:pimeloyl-ACP methyl ester carboxylesterase
MTMRHHKIEANEISLHFVEEGEGPAVLFCHGFPAIWSSWKVQMEAVASAGFKAIALDLRGYGESSSPAEAEAYTPYHTVGDVVAVLDAAGVATAVIVGHDWGANVAWNAAMMRPDRFTAVCGMSVQFRPPGGPNFLDKLRAAGKHQFYMFSPWDDVLEFWRGTGLKPMGSFRSVARPVPPGSHASAISRSGLPR